MNVGRTVPPVGYRMPIGDVCDALTEAGITPEYRRTVFEPQAARRFSARRAMLVSSGKAALTLILRALHTLSSRTKVIVPAYTCYSVPSAIVKAGLDVVPCDLGADSFDYDYKRLEELLDSSIACVLSVHLFGIRSDTLRLKALCEPKGIVVVEDAAQAYGCGDGTDIGTVGDAAFFSWGRGKNISAGSGGLVLTASERIAEALDAQAKTLPSPGALDSLSTFASVLLQSLLISPSLYWVPSSMPFLRLGETIFHEDFPVRALSDFQAVMLDRGSSQLASLNSARRLNAEYYVTHVTGAKAHGRCVPYLRFPMLLRDVEQKRRVLGNGGTALGISGMYPTTVGDIPQLQGRIDRRSYPAAQRVVDCLITLPTHPLVSDRDRRRISELLNAL